MTRCHCRYGTARTILPRDSEGRLFTPAGFVAPAVSHQHHHDFSLSLATFTVFNVSANMITCVCLDKDSHHSHDMCTQRFLYDAYLQNVHTTLVKHDLGLPCPDTPSVISLAGLDEDDYDEDYEEETEKALTTTVKPKVVEKCEGLCNCSMIKGLEDLVKHQNDPSTQRSLSACSTSTGVCSGILIVISAFCGFLIMLHCSKLLFIHHRHYKILFMIICANDDLFYFQRIYDSSNPVPHGWPPDDSVWSERNPKTLLWKSLRKDLRNLRLLVSCGPRHEYMCDTY